jgi:hypothetical protein
MQLHEALKVLAKIDSDRHEVRVRFHRLYEFQRGARKCSIPIHCRLKSAWKDCFVCSFPVGSRAIGSYRCETPKDDFVA